MMGELSDNIRDRIDAINAFYDKKERTVPKIVDGLVSLERPRELRKLRVQRRALMLAALDLRNIILLPDEWGSAEEHRSS